MDQRPLNFCLLSLNGKRIHASKQPIEIIGKLLTSEKDIAKAFSRFYCGVSNFYPISLFTKKTLSPVNCSLEWDSLFNSPFSDGEFHGALSAVYLGIVLDPKLNRNKHE
ncbi:hypothetical protein JTE90_029504 [Oedothorax gibbosus]|uniref:Uncharacterized protein n=1 Tax=Oedothorax gibbosus TaxID=931172 RepID=A0AAV6UHM6_9ARAC|nr:hypothetical protein JTE90_029504 [Oedothorax gibbosus]